MSQLSGTTCEDFCQTLIGFQDTCFLRTYNGNPASRIICRGSNLTVMADLSPLCVGHLLLVSNYHYYSYAEVCHDHLDEVMDVTSQVMNLYYSAFGDPLVLEHGSSPDSDSSSCINHAHWHFLPVSADRVFEIMTEDGLEYTELRDLGELAQIAHQQAPYYYAADSRYRRIYGINRSMRQQYLRSVVGRILEIPDPEWDWALVIRKDYLRATVAATAGWRLGGRYGPYRSEQLEEQLVEQ